MSPPDVTSAEVPTRTTLLTGATGLLGRYLLRDLLLAGESVAVLVRPNALAPGARVEALLDLWSGNGHPDLPRPVVLAGDVSRPGLGLDARTRRDLAGRVDRVVHNAAIIRFHGGSRHGEPWRTNADGTAHVLDFCRELGVDDLHHVSTAYTCGDRGGTILEEELDAGQGFRNAYEQSKFEAERAVRRAGDVRHRTIYRPGVIAGDARTGYTSSFHGFFAYLRALSIMVAGIQPGANGVRRLPYSGRLPLDEPRNVVPVDWVSGVIVRLLGRPEARGRSYHLTPARPVTPREVIDHAASYYGSGRIEVVTPREPVDLLRHLAAAQRMLRGYESYGGTEARFDTRNLARFASDLPCPPLDEAVVHRYLAYAERAGWGR
jgi:nucleoside-diphosphate-sugar epimerase